jgi:hypothetical protein
MATASVCAVLASTAALTTPRRRRLLPPPFARPTSPVRRTPSFIRQAFCAAVDHRPQVLAYGSFAGFVVDVAILPLQARSAGVLVGQRSNVPVEEKRQQYLATLQLADATDDHGPPIAIALS